MPTKKYCLTQLKGDWTAGEIRVSYKHGVIAEPVIGNVKDGYNFVSSVWDKELITLQEQMMAVFVNRTGQVIGYRLLNTGNIGHCEVDVRLLVCMALHCMASSVIIAHNHPSGNLMPSEHDMILTKKIADALLLIDTKLLDHLIIGIKGWFSMFYEGLL